MQYLLPVLLAAHFLLLLNIWMNRVSIRRRYSGPSGQTAESHAESGTSDQLLISILVPARNEADNLPRLIRSFKEQSYPWSEMIIYDDQSDDATWEIMVAASDTGENIKAIKGGPLTQGWVGKVHACHSLAKAAKGDVFLFLDADTKFLHPCALHRFVDLYRTRHPDTVITGIPEIRGGGLLIVSMVGHFILSLVPWWLKNKIPASIFAGVNGQCWIIDGGLYRSLMPHAAVHDQVLEDVMIGRYLHRNGVTPVLVDISPELAVYMYSDLRAAWGGFRKNASAMLGANTGTALCSWLIYVLLYVAAPLFFPVLFLSLMVLKLSTDRAIGQPFWISLLTPVSVVLIAFLGLDSIVARSRKRLVWKGRKI